MDNYTYEQKKADKKRYGCLDGDNAKRCSGVGCANRFTGSRASKCPVCNTSEKSIPTDCPHCHGEREWLVYNHIAICHFCGKEENI